MFWHFCLFLSPCFVHFNLIHIFNSFVLFFSTSPFSRFLLLLSRFFLKRFHSTIFPKQLQEVPWDFIRISHIFLRINQLPADAKRMIRHSSGKWCFSRYKIQDTRYKIFKLFYMENELKLRKRPV